MALGTWGAGHYPAPTSASTMILAKPLLLPFLRHQFDFGKTWCLEEVKSDPQRLALDDADTHLLMP